MAMLFISSEIEEVVRRTRRVVVLRDAAKAAELTGAQISLGQSWRRLPEAPPRRRHNSATRW